MSMVGKTIKWYRNQAGWTQEQLAEGICSPAYVSQLENDLIPSNNDVLLEICKRLNINERKVSVHIDTDLLHKVDDWINSIHEFDIDKAKKYYEEIKDKIDKDTHFDIEYLYHIALLGYYLITDQLIQVDEVYDMISPYKDLYRERDHYSYYKFIGIYYKRKGLFLDALDHFKQAEKIIGDEGEPELFLVLALTYSYLNKILISNRYVNKAINGFHEKLYYNRIIECQIVLNQNHYFVGDFKNNYLLQRLIESVDEPTNDKTKANIYNHFGFVHYMQREYEKSIEYLLKIKQLNVNEADFLKSRHALASIYFNTNKINLALKEISEGLEIAKQYNLERYTIKFKILQLSIENNKERLVDYLKDYAIPFFRKSGELNALKNCYRTIGNTLYDLKRYKSAAEYFKQLDLDSLLL